jgi:hypothetical protein
VVMGLLAKKPEDRYGSAAELVEDLRWSLAGLPRPSLGPLGTPKPFGPPRLGQRP